MLTKNACYCNILYIFEDLNKAREININRGVRNDSSAGISGNWVEDISLSLSPCLSHRTMACLDNKGLSIDTMYIAQRLFLAPT